MESTCWTGFDVPVGQLLIADADGALASPTSLPVPGRRAAGSSG